MQHLGFTKWLAEKIRGCYATKYSWKETLEAQNGAKFGLEETDIEEKGRRELKINTQRRGSSFMMRFLIYKYFADT